MIDIDKIEAAAVAATPGPWECGEDADHEWYFTEQGNADSSIGWTVVNAEANATHIATANPATVLEMVSMIRERDELQFQIGDMTVALAERDAVLRQALDALECIDSPMYVFEINKVGAAIAAIKGVLND